MSLASFLIFFRERCSCLAGQQTMTRLAVSLEYVKNMVYKAHVVLFRDFLSSAISKMKFEHFGYATLALVTVALATLVTRAIRRYWCVEPPGGRHSLTDPAPIPSSSSSSSSSDGPLPGFARGPLRPARRRSARIAARVAARSPSTSPDPLTLPITNASGTAGAMNRR